MRRFWVIGVCIICYSFSNAAVEYDGNNLLTILGQSIASPAFKEFKAFWLLDKNLQNNSRGIKIYINPISDKVESIIVAGENPEIGGSKLNKCTAPLPFDINLDDDTARLIKKFGPAEKLLGRSALRFYKDTIVIEASFTDLKTGKIWFLKFNTGTKPVGAVTVPPPAAPVKKENIIEKHRQMDREAFLSGNTIAKPEKKEPAQPAVIQKDTNVVTAVAVVPPLPVKKETITDKRKQEEEAAFLAGSTNTKPEQKNELKTVTIKRDTNHVAMIVSPPPTPVKSGNAIEKNRQIQQAAFFNGADNSTTSATKQAQEKFTTPMTPFKKAIMDVFTVSRGYSLDSIKNGERSEGNFWNYKYTYKTTIKVPGEKYNMLYSFPFVTSQLDFVVVLKESDSFEKSLESMYHTFEKQLIENFPASEGWEATCLPGKDKSHLPDLEFRNDKYGAIILDHTQNPKGRHVLYLRFLLFSD